MKIVFTVLTYILVGAAGYLMASFVYSRSMQAQTESLEKSFKLNEDRWNAVGVHSRLDGNLNYISLVKRKYTQPKFKSANPEFFKKNSENEMNKQELLESLCFDTRALLKWAESYAEFEKPRPGEPSGSYDNRVELRKSAKEVIALMQSGGDCPKA